MNLNYKHHFNFFQNETVFCECNVKQHFIQNKKCILDLKPETYVNHMVDRIDINTINSKWIFRIIKIRYVNKI